MRYVSELLCGNRRMHLVAVGLAALLLAVSLVGLYYSSKPAQAQEAAVTLYQHRGQFDYVAYATPGVLYSDEFQLPDPTAMEDDAAATVEDVPRIFFRNLLQDVDLIFTYDVECAEPLSMVQSEATITIFAEHPRLWRNDMREWTASTDSRRLRVRFPLDYELMEMYVKQVGDEIGITRSQSDFIIEAYVRTTGLTLQGQMFDEQYVHTVKAILKDNTLELDGDLRGSTGRSVGDTALTLDGRFDYEVYMKQSSLYDDEVLRSEPLRVADADSRYAPTVEPQPATQIRPGQVLYPQTIQSIEATFGYDFSSEGRIEEATQEVTVVATLSSGTQWNKELTLVPTTPLTERSVSFPIDVEYFGRVVEAIGEQTGARSGSYDIAIEARVHTRATVAGKAIDEVYTQLLTGSRSGAQLTFSDNLTNTEQGSIETGEPVTTPGGNDLRPLSLIGVVTGVAALSFLGVIWVRGGRRDEAARALSKTRKQYRETLVDVDEIPASSSGDTTVSVRTIDDLARVAEQAGKSILCYVATDAPTFLVLDNGVRYVHRMRPPQHPPAAYE